MLSPVLGLANLQLGDTSISVFAPVPIFKIVFLTAIDPYWDHFFGKFPELTSAEHEVATNAGRIPQKICDPGPDA
jgi:hypothetical protein